MKPGRELDTIIAEKVMGWKRFECKMFGETKSFEEFPEITEHIVLMPPDFKITSAQPPIGASLQEACAWEPPEMPTIPHYSTSIEAAWEVVEKCLEEGWEFDLFMNGIQYDVGLYRDREKPSGIGDTAPHAICLAALKASGIKIY